MPAAISSVEYFALIFFQTQAQRAVVDGSSLVQAPMNSAWATAVGNLPLHVLTMAFFASSKRGPWKSPMKSTIDSVLRSAG